MMKRGLRAEEYQALARFRFALRRFESFSGDAAKSAGLSPAQHQLLLAIRGHETPSPSVSDVAERLLIKVHSATELVARAEANGLVRRTTDPADGRRITLDLTAAGDEVLATLSRVHRDELRRFREEMYDVLGELSSED